MAYTNAHLRIELGNVVSHVRGPAPNDSLDRALNPHAQAPGGDGRNDWYASQVGGSVRRALVYDSREQTFLTGALGLVEETLQDQGCPYHVTDGRCTQPPLHDWDLQGVELREYQEEVVQKAIDRGTGTIDLGTSGGKTILAASIIARIGLPTIYLVTTRTLLHQTVESLREYLGFEPGVIGDGVRKPGPVTVAIAQAVVYGTVSLDRWKGGVLVWDEGHHAAAPSYLELVKRIDARFNFFLSAVPYRSGDDQIVLDAVTGGTLTDGEYSARYLIEHGYACPVEVQIERATTKHVMVEQPFWKIYRECIVLNLERNLRIAEIAREAIKAGESILILVERLQHGRLLEEKIDESVEFVHGSVPKKKLRKLTEEFAEGRLACLIATVGLFNEGVSIHGITMLLNAGGMKSRGKVLQAVGRGMRQSESRGKTRCLFVDFFDDDPIGILRAHSRQRLEVLMDEGFRVPRVDPGWKATAGTATDSRGSEDVTTFLAEEKGDGESGARAEQDAVEEEAAWMHVPSTKLFVKVTGQGQIVARGECIRKSNVPESFCKRCKESWICKLGGKTTWQSQD